MIKCFLSHSSKDKNYVHIVSKNLKKNFKIIDDEDFLQGEITKKEIIKFLEITTIFVFFISRSSLDSNWVREEINYAKELFDKGHIKKIIPIIIDKGISHADSKLPEWLSDEYNIQYIPSPNYAVKIIKATILDLSLELNPKLKERSNIFVGRAELIKKIEERMDDYLKESPVCMIASGLQSIGRRSLLKHALKKSNALRKNEVLFTISLTEYDGIDDFILKLTDLGVFESDSKYNQSVFLIDKIRYAIDLMEKMSSINVRVLVEDNGSIVNWNGNIADWFLDIIKDSNVENIVFIMVSKYKIYIPNLYGSDKIYSLSVPELDKKERDGLFIRYMRFLDHEISSRDIPFFSDLLKGFPKQVFFTCDYIVQYGIFEAKKNSHEIASYSSDAASLVLNKYKDDDLYSEIIFLLSKFDFISLDVLYSIIEQEKSRGIIRELLNSSICEYVGSLPDYIRLNEAIKDYVSRFNFGQTSIFDEKIKQHAIKYINEFSDIEGNIDISDYIFSLQVALKNDHNLPSKFLIPSIFIKTIKELYNERNYKSAIILSDRVLINNQSIDDRTIHTIRYIKCQCLARIDSKEFYNEINLLKSGVDKLFLFGFFFRITGKNSESIEKLSSYLEKRPNDIKAKAELVLAYMNDENSNKALELAKENYNKFPDNPINANNYFNCLIVKEKNDNNKKILNDIVEQLELSPFEKSREMSLSARARLIAFYDNDQDGAFDAIQIAIEKYPDIIYPHLTKAELAVHFKKLDLLEEALSVIRKKTYNSRGQTYNSVIKYDAMVLAMKQKQDEAISLIHKNLMGLSDQAKEKLIDKIKLLASQ